MSRNRGQSSHTVRDQHDDSGGVNKVGGRKGTKQTRSSRVNRITGKCSAISSRAARDHELGRMENEDGEEKKKNNEQPVGLT